MYIWGNTKNNLTNVDYTLLPDEIQPGNVAYASAGADHIIAITTDGKGLRVDWRHNKKTNALALDLHAENVSDLLKTATKDKLDRQRHLP